MPRFHPLCRRVSHALARLGVLALLLNAVFMGLHHRPALLAAFAGPDSACVDYQPAIDVSHHEETDDQSPAHPGIRCPFCTLVQGAKLVPPSPWLVFPPAPVSTVRAPPDQDQAPPTILVAAHRSRGPPAQS